MIYFKPDPCSEVNTNFTDSPISDVHYFATTTAAASSTHDQGTTIDFENNTILENKK